MMADKSLPRLSPAPALCSKGPVEAECSKEWKVSFSVAASHHI